MDVRLRLLLLSVLLAGLLRPAAAVDARFDLIGPRIDVRVTRIDAHGQPQTLPIAAVPNLQPGDRLWLHPNLPASQSAKYLLICVFLRGTTNPPPDDWFTRIETWDRHVREEGTFITVPPEAQQAILLMAPETGGDFSTLKSAVKGRPGAFVRASQDLTEAGFEEARIEKYIASIRRVPPSDPAELQRHSDLLARTLALKPNSTCFKQPVDTQFTCLTQTGSQIVLDDGHGQTIVNALANGPSSDFINQASYTQAFGAGVYSAYVGAIVDLIRIMGNLHTAQYQYIPAISFPQQEAMNLRLNTPPSFHNPKSVLVIALPAVQSSTPPPLRPADAHEIACLLKPTVVLPIEGAPLVFSTDFAHDLVLHFNTPPGARHEPDIPLVPDAYSGGLVLQQGTPHHVPLRDPLANPPTQPVAGAHPAPPPGSIPEPVLISGVIQGRWGFDPYVGPSVTLQQLPGSDWSIVPSPHANSLSSDLIAGHTAQLLLTSTGTACVHTITARPPGLTADVQVQFKPVSRPGDPNGEPLPLELTLPLQRDIKPGDLNLAILQYDQPKADLLAARTYAEPANVSSIELHASDKTMLLKGTRLGEIDRLQLGDLTFRPQTDPDQELDQTAAPTEGVSLLRLSLPANAPAPPTHIAEHLTATLTLKDGRNITLPVVVSSPRPVITLLRKTVTPPAGTDISLSNANDLPLDATLTFTLKSPTVFPRNGEVEIETVDGTLRTVLTLAPSGGLQLQDPHTVVATLDPERSFGPSAFGALQFRALYPPPGHPAPFSAPANPSSPTETAAGQTAAATGSSLTIAGTSVAAVTDSSNSDPGVPASDWLPLATLVRLPALTLLQCPPEIADPCTLTGTHLFLLQSLSTAPDFSSPVPIPDGFTGRTLTIPHPSAATIFLKLRDDASSVDTAILPTPPPPPAPHLRSRRSAERAEKAEREEKSADEKAEKSADEKSRKDDKADEKSEKQAIPTPEPPAAAPAAPQPTTSPQQVPPAPPPVAR
jgi:hypothetical protein